jgi:tyrosinase
MADVYSSVLDPLFWLHHARLDKIWYDWQSQDPARLHDIDGPTKACTSHGTTKLSDMLWMGFNAPDKPISAVMDTLNQDGSGILCYKYE